MDRQYFINLANRKKRYDKGRFRDLIRAPQTLNGGPAPGASASIKIPANARLAVSSDVPVGIAEIGVGVGNNVLKTSDLSANQIYRVGYAEAGKYVWLQKDTPGSATLSLYILDEFGVPRLIATSSFT